MNLSSRVTKLNNAKENSKGRYVLYWMQMFKRASHNYALNFAIEMANERQLPLVVYEGLKYYYPWASDRFHTSRPKLIRRHSLVLRETRPPVV